MSLGPGYMPPQGARALVGALLGGYRNGPEVAATLESHTGETVLEFVNEGAATAVGLRCLYREPTGELAREYLGNVSPAGTASCRVHVEAGRPFRCVWGCDDGRRGVRLWSYDGRRKRLRTRRRGDDVLFNAVYG
jgi:hypothetical protein